MQTLDSMRSIFGRGPTADRIGMAKEGSGRRVIRDIALRHARPPQIVAGGFVGFISPGPVAPRPEPPRHLLGKAASSP